jgi:hypothetical protein
MDEAQWLACIDPARMLEIVRGKVSDRKLRLFDVACCRCAWHLLADRRSQRAVEAAERYADGALTGEQLAAVRVTAGEALIDAKRAEYIAEAEANFCETPQYRATVVDLCAACAARATVSAIAGVCISGINGRETEGPGEARDNSRPCHEWAALALTEVSRLALREAREYAARRWGDAAGRTEAVEPASLLRDIVGPLPFRAIALDPAWRTTTVTDLALAAYQERDLPSGHLNPARLAILADALEEAGAVGELVEHLRGPGPHVRGWFAVDAVFGKR